MPGTPRFGLMYADGDLKPRADEQRIIDQIVELRGQTPAMSYSRIAGLLNNAAMLMRGKYWNPVTVRHIYNQEQDRRKREGDGGENV